MKKAWKWVLAILGVMILAGAFIVIDAYRRAVNAIESQDHRLRTDIADLRAGIRSIPSPTVAPFSPADLKLLPCPVEAFVNDDEATAGIERGHTGQHERAIPRQRGLWRSKKEPTVDEALAAMAVTLATFREGGLRAHEIKNVYEQANLQALLLRVAGSGQKAADLRRLQSKVDDLLAMRVPVQHFIRGEHLLDRAEVLRVIPTQSDPTMMILEPPGWKELYSWRILVAKSLTQLGEVLRVKEPAPDDDFPELNTNSSYAALGLRAAPERRPLTSSRLWGDLRSVHSSERYCLSHWQAARLAIAIRLFDLEKGREPRELAELVPEYLSAVPLSPYGAKPFVFVDGVLKARGAGREWRITR